MGFFPGPSRKVHSDSGSLSLGLSSSSPLPRNVAGEGISEGPYLFLPELRTVVSVCLFVICGFGNLGPTSLQPWHSKQAYSMTPSIYGDNATTDPGRHRPLRRDTP